MDPGAVLNNWAGERGRAAGKICRIPGAEGGRDILQILKAYPWNGEPRGQTTCRISGADLCRRTLACRSAPGHHANLCDLRVCLSSCHCLRPDPSLTFQAVTVELYLATSSLKRSQKKLKEPRFEQSAVVALAVVWRRLRRRLPKAMGKTAPLVLGEGRRLDAAWDLQKSFP